MKNKIIFLISLMSVCILMITNLGLISNGSCSPEILDFKFTRTNGYSDGKGSIQGHFSISITGSTDVTQIQLLFNDTIVTNSSSSTLKFNFNTDDYPHGEYNITAIVCDNSGFCVQESEKRIFVDASVNDPYWLLLGVAGVVIVVVIILVNLKAKKDHIPPKKDSIKIDEL